MTLHCPAGRPNLSFALFFPFSFVLVSLLFVVLLISLLLVVRWFCFRSILRACLDFLLSVLPGLYLSIRSLRLFWFSLFDLLSVLLRFHLFIRSLRPYVRLQFPDPPGLLMLPVPVPFPVPPVALNAMMGNSLVIPLMPPPAALPVVTSPVRGDFSIKRGNALIVYPASTVFPGAVPATFPRTPPPAIVEKDIHVCVRDCVNIGPRQHDQRWWLDKYDGRRQGDTDADTSPSSRWVSKT